MDGCATSIIRRWPRSGQAWAWPFIYDQASVNLNVPVDIALDQTDLHRPFVGLEEVVAPYRNLLSSLPDTWGETPLCGALTGWFCDWFLASK
jgi:hypothetical protein